MPVKVLKLVSEQSGPFSRTNNKVESLRTLDTVTCPKLV